MKIEEVTGLQIQQEQEKQRISTDEVSEVSEISELSDEEMLQIAGGSWVDDVLKVVTKLEPLVIPLITA
ncbi:hypothetical protein [Nostoc sp.]|uniref:hypothetical protein n=1 Tax=Nostoc sp. TaxID=1180 RepID=UPI002FF51A63